MFVRCSLYWTSPRKKNHGHTECTFWREPRRWLAKVRFQPPPPPPTLHRVE
ncbi:hypothetical protein JB92DRAFT_2895771 [Gautieria morchelliformis]|nr:hypothetical protein JB92DRAFT_2895771 [Gautieria morchelliformis]